MNLTDHDSEAGRLGSVSAQDMRALAKRFQTLLEKERTSLAQELHDNLTQKLTVISLELSLMDSSILSETELPRTSLRDKIKELNHIVSDMIQSLRKIKTELRPKVLDEFGLGAALEWETEEFARKTGLKCRFKTRPDEVALPPDLATELFRMFRQIMANISAHAHARRVDVEVRHSRGVLVIKVGDDGRGITPEEIRSRKSLGLLELRERASAIGGELAVEGKPKGGTTVTITVPLAPSRAGKGQASEHSPPANHD